jgi:ferredoxin
LFSAPKSIHEFGDSGVAFKDPKYDKPIQLRKTRRPKQLAVIDQSGCTGCGVCIDFCPADCILVVPGPDPQNPTIHRLVEVNLPRCIERRA